MSKSSSANAARNGSTDPNGRNRVGTLPESFASSRRVRWMHQARKLSPTPVRAARSCASSNASNYDPHRKPPQVRQSHPYCPALQLVVAGPLCGMLRPAFRLIKTSSTSSASRLARSSARFAMPVRKTKCCWPGFRRCLRARNCSASSTKG